LTALKFEDCGSLDVYVTKIQNFLDQCKLGSDESDSIGVKKHVFYLVHGITEGDDWDMELRLIEDKLHTEGQNRGPTKIINSLQNRESEKTKMKSINLGVLLYTC
jgi:hypothetical protein